MNTFKLISFTFLFWTSVAIVSSVPDEDEQIVAQEFPFTAVLDSKAQVLLRWNFNNEVITLQLTAPTLGWIGLGFNYKTSMKGADLIIMGVKNDGIYALDASAEDNETPQVDDEQNIEIISGYENGTHTTVTVRRMQAACYKNDTEITEGTYRVLWAFGQNDIEEHPKSANYHFRNRGGKSLKLLNHFPKMNQEDFSEEVKYFDVRAHDFKVPGMDTFYLCKIFEIPDYENKQHIIGFDPVITPGNEKNVHHLLIYLCLSGADLDKLNKSFQCLVDINLYRIGCRKIIAGWAVGMTGVRFPSHTGMPIGGSNQPRYIAIETHYDNTEEEEFYDSSGLRFYYTEKLREKDIGTATISYDFRGIWVPPKSEIFKIQGQCPASCLEKGMTRSNLEEVTLVGTMLHAHKVGRKMKLRAFRNNTEIKPIAVEEHYDFDYQEVQYFEDGAVKLRRGDSLMVECGYGTTEKESVTTGGFSTKNEMCSAFVFYYPAITLDYCTTVPISFGNNVIYNLESKLNITISMEELSLMRQEIQKNVFAQADIVAPIFNRVKWTSKKKKLFQDLINGGAMTNVICRYGNIHETDTIVDLANNDGYAEPDRCKEKKISEITYNVHLYVLAGVILSAIVLAGARFTTPTD